jgi:NADH:ubiquinone oxidoreductase subunit 2 (subunit N)
MLILMTTLYDLLDSVRIELSGLVLDTNNYTYLFIVLFLFYFLNIEMSFNKIILILGLTGVIVAILSKDFITIFLSIELYSISISILIFRHMTKDVIKYGIIYFLLSNISSTIFLFGLYSSYLNHSINELMLISILFKLGMFPFQFWILRIYPLLSNYLLSYVLTIGKLPLFLFIYRNLINNINNTSDYNMIISFIIIFSIL